MGLISESGTANKDNQPMESSLTKKPTAPSLPIHTWLKTQTISFVPGPLTPLLESVAADILKSFQKMGHVVEETPSENTTIILTTLPYGEPLSWRDSLIFTTRRRFGLNHHPTIISMIHLMPDVFDAKIAELDALLKEGTPDDHSYQFDGLAPEAFQVLYEQGKRGGAILALERLIQAQSKSIRTLLVVGDEAPEKTYHFDLVGAHPVTNYVDSDSFYEDIVYRIVTTQSTREITAHQAVEEKISLETWESLDTTDAMMVAARQLGSRNFFTDTVTVADLVRVPAVSDAIASQYSEGCFGTWDPTINGLLATVTGSARPVHKGSITKDDLAIIIGVREDGLGALVRHVDGKQNDPPSSEAVELKGMDDRLPTIQLSSDDWGYEAEVPVIRSKLHGHRGIAAYDPNLVEHVPLDPPFYHYPVSCATEAQATGIMSAFARSEALLNPDDPRSVVFTVLPGHGIVIVEKWLPDKVPFQIMWEYMDDGSLQVDNFVPQGVVTYQLGKDGRYHLIS
jgi:hypothetical protein